MSDSRIDPRAPRLTAGVTAVVLLVAIYLLLAGPTAAGVVLLAVLVASFAWGAVAGVRRHPLGWVFRRFVRPLLAPPAELEDAAPPTFAQGVGLVVTGVGLVAALLGATTLAAVFAGLAFVAAFLNAVFGYCLGCQIYLLLARAGLFRRTA
ncbi:DUF4395 domain-containing protein [Desertivibrio insolitus]|uniref:DUF4395 domain-containing protein n=1 Tax=Herbiconiux sp. SYSU D00978 TaxID=2812562 RepID=UPI001A96F03C|nr:DUF4395 domain-containing protein [Herbiconiux sp. SYSU D00978]